MYVVKQNYVGKTIIEGISKTNIVVRQTTSNFYTTTFRICLEQQPDLIRYVERHIRFHRIIISLVMLINEIQNTGANSNALHITLD
ncbi:MAG: hypothetical protein CBB94_11895 [Gammaproteobacteria bacterium TMED34]|nr:MAG: hypothetical protein CBB94_11895 [Gammaproteobacteria bacterium TMED34]